jgi:hypothetical protein
MSDYPTKSQRQEWNNDGMDPDWRPESSPELETISKIKRLYYSCRPLQDVLTKEPVDINVDYRVTMSGRLWKEILDAMENFK